MFSTVHCFKKIKVWLPRPKLQLQHISRALIQNVHLGMASRWSTFRHFNKTASILANTNKTLRAEHSADCRYPGSCCRCCTVPWPECCCALPNSDLIDAKIKVMSSSSTTLNMILCCVSIACLYRSAVKSLLPVVLDLCTMRRMHIPKELYIIYQNPCLIYQRISKVNIYIT